MRWRGRLEEMVLQKKKAIAFKTTSTISDEDDEEEDDEEVSLLVKNVEGCTTKQNSTIEGDGKERKKRRSFASIVGSRGTSLRSVQKIRLNPPPPRSHTRRKL